VTPARYITGFVTEAGILKAAELKRLLHPAAPRPKKTAKKAAKKRR